MLPDRRRRLDDAFPVLIDISLVIGLYACMFGSMLWLVGAIWACFDEEAAVAVWCLNAAPYAFWITGIVFGILLGLVMPTMILYGLGQNVFLAHRRTIGQTRRGDTKGNVRWLIRFLVYCAGWVAFVSLCLALVLMVPAVLDSGHFPWWPLRLLGYPVTRIDLLPSTGVPLWVRGVNLAILIVLAKTTIFLATLHIRFAKRHGFRHPFCDNTPEIRKVEGVWVDHEGQKYYVTWAQYLQGGEPLSYTVERLTNEGVRDVTLLFPEEVTDAKAQEILEHSRKPLDRIRGSAAKIAYIDKHADDETKNELWRGETTVNHEYRKLKKAEVRQGRSKRRPKTRPNKHPAEDFCRETRDARASQSGKVHLTTFEPPSPAAESPKPKPRP